MNDKAYRMLCDLACERETTTYREFADYLGMEEHILKCMGPLKAILAGIADSVHHQGEPMLTAVVVRKDWHIPGRGFFVLARDYGLYQGGLDKQDRPAQRKFAKRELRRVFDAWDKPGLD